MWCSVVCDGCADAASHGNGHTTTSDDTYGRTPVGCVSAKYGISLNIMRKVTGARAGRANLIRRKGLTMIFSRRGKL